MVGKPKLLRSRKETSQVFTNKIGCIWVYGCTVNGCIYIYICMDIDMLYLSENHTVYICISMSLQKHHTSSAHLQSFSHKLTNAIPTTTFDACTLSSGCFRRQHLTKQPSVFGSSRIQRSRESSFTSQLHFTSMAGSRTVCDLGLSLCFENVASTC